MSFVPSNLRSRPQPALGFAAPDPFSEPPAHPAPAEGRQPPLAASRPSPTTSWERFFGFFSPLHLFTTPIHYIPSTVAPGTVLVSLKKKKKGGVSGTFQGNGPLPVARLQDEVFAAAVPIAPGPSRLRSPAAAAAQGAGWGAEAGRQRSRPSPTGSPTGSAPVVPPPAAGTPAASPWRRGRAALREGGPAYPPRRLPRARRPQAPPPSGGRPGARRLCLRSLRGGRSPRREEQGRRFLSGRGLQAR